MMGMILPEDEELLWIAEESLLAPLPEGMPESGRAVWRPAVEYDVLFGVQRQSVIHGYVFDNSYICTYEDGVLRSVVGYVM